MSKRARLSSDDARRAGLHAWETPEGRRWLLKSLNPNDVSVAAAGIPTLQSRNISVLNWQGEYSVDVPANLNANNPSYDSTMFLYQHPLIFGMSATRPEGTMDMRDFPRYFLISRSTGTAGTDAAVYTLTTASAPAKPISMSRCVQYLNNQVDPSVFNGDVSLAGRRKLFTQLTQKNRITYGGATIIPTCSAEHNGGSLAVCQQVFSPRKSIVENNNDLELDTFLASDFPDTSDLVQNPQMYYGRFQDGAYIPYKLHDPSKNIYSSSEQQITTRSPYFVKEVTFIGTEAADSATPDLTEVPATYSGVNVNQFTASSSRNMYRVFGIRLYIQTYTGLSGHITFSLADSANAAANSSVFWVNESGTAKVCANLDRTLIKEGTAWSSVSAAAASLELSTVYLKLPELVTAYDWVGASLLANPYGSYWISEDITTQVNPSDKDLLLGTICPYNGQSLITIHISGASNTAPIKMLLRYGVEILLTASSPYSPFKFMSPRYDESAIKSYARCIRSMRDAYFANAGSIPGQTDYVNKLMALIENDSADDLNRAMNQGGAWTGVVGAY